MVLGGGGAHLLPVRYSLVLDCANIINMYLFQIFRAPHLVVLAHGHHGQQIRTSVALLVGVLHLQRV
eukprot:8445302-Pyramimonas_sp.AAC.1